MSFFNLLLSHILAYCVHSFILTLYYVRLPGRDFSWTYHDGVG